MGGAADLAFGLATSVGPVPYASVDDAVGFALRTHPRFPTVPVTTVPGSSLLSQAVHGLDGVTVVGEPADAGVAQSVAQSGDGVALSVDGPICSPSAAADAGRCLDSPAFAAVNVMAERLAASAEARRDGLPPAATRVGVLGPVTLASYLRAAGVAERDAVEVATAVTAARAVAVLRVLLGPSPLRSGNPPVAVVLAEPALVGSMHPTHPVLPGQVRAMLDPVLDALDAAAGDGSLLIGVHVPGPCDWPTVISSGVSFLPVPVDRSLLGWASQLGGLLDRGGRLCWGAVPVDRPMGASETPHWRRLVELWTALVAEGVDPMLLRLRSSFSPAGGLARFTPEGADLVMGLTSAVADRVGHQAVAARLSLGA